MKWLLRQGFACWSGIWKCFSESAESVYLRCISHEMVFAARVRLLIRDMEMFMKALKVCIHSWHIPWNDSCGECLLINYKYGDVNERWMSTMRSQAISAGHIKLWGANWNGLIKCSCNSLIPLQWDKDHGRRLDEVDKLERQIDASSREYSGSTTCKESQCTR